MDTITIDHNCATLHFKEQLQISDMEMNTLMFESGCVYLEENYPDVISEKALTHPIFWKWWKLQFRLYTVSMAKRGVKDTEMAIRVLKSSPFRPGSIVWKLILKD